MDHCRLEQEYIMAVVRNRSGVDSGEIDFNIKTYRFDSLNERDLKRTIFILKRLIEECNKKLIGARK